MTDKSIVSCLRCNNPTLRLRSDTRYCKECRQQLDRERSKDWYDKYKGTERDKRAQYAKAYRKSHPEQRLWWGARDRARKFNLEFNLELEDVKIPTECPILKVPLEVLSRHAPSLDRINPTKGYIKDNVWVISSKANVMKNDATLEELERFADWVKTLRVS